MASTKSSVLENTSDREIMVTRVFSSPRAMLWATWIDPWHDGILSEIVPPQLLAYTDAWDSRSDVSLLEHGDPHETLMPVRFEEQSGKTTMRFQQTPFATAAERDGHNGGWTSSFERLEDLVHSLEGKEQA